MRLAQVLGEEFAGLTLEQRPLAIMHVPLRTCERIEMASARAEVTLSRTIERN